MSQQGSTKRVVDIIDIEDKFEYRFDDSYSVATSDGPDYWVSGYSDGLQYLLTDLPREVSQNIETRDDKLAVLSDCVGGIIEVDNSRTAEFLNEIHNRYGTLTISSRLMGSDEIDYHSEQIPLRFAVYGKSLIYAYLAGHDFNNDEIAEVCGVSESTVRVNLSKFKNN